MEHLDQAVGEDCADFHLEQNLTSFCEDAAHPWVSVLKALSCWGHQAQVLQARLVDWEALGSPKAVNEQNQKRVLCV